MNNLTTAISNLNKNTNSNYFSGHYKYQTTTEACTPSQTLEISETMFKTTLEEYPKSTWLMDSGASCSFTNDKSLFIKDTFKRSSTGQVTIGNGERLEIEGVGDITTLAYRNGIVESITLHDVYYVPTLSCNLLSLNVTAKRGNIYIGQNNELHVYKNGQHKLTGKQNTSANVLELVQSIPEDPTASDCVAFLETANSHLPVNTPSCFTVAKTLSTPTRGSLMFWHLALNHRCPKDIIRMARSGKIKGMK